MLNAQIKRLQRDHASTRQGKGWRKWKEYLVLLDARSADEAARADKEELMGSSHAMQLEHSALVEAMVRWSI